MSEESKKMYTKKQYKHAQKVATDIGKSLGEYETTEAVRKAYAAGKIEWWLEKMRPKTLEEWEQWVEDNGDLNSLS